MKVKVSIITPVYNCEKYVERCINSLINQTYENIEIIMVDDGSKDKSAQIIKECQKKSDKIIYIYQDNSGPGVARNRAIKEAGGKYILFVDADDYISEDYIKHLVETAEKNNSELTIAGYTMVYENGKKEKKVVPEFYERNKAEEWAYRISACCSRMYLRDFWMKYEIKFNEERNARAEDVPIVLFSNVMAKNISIVKNAGYYYYQHSGSAMNDRSKRVVFGFPYKAFEEMYFKVCNGKIENNLQYFHMGVLKFLAHFFIVIYRNASKQEKMNFIKDIERIVNIDFFIMIMSWKGIRRNIDLPFLHKIAIEYFILNYKQGHLK